MRDLALRNRSVRSRVLGAGVHRQSSLLRRVKELPMNKPVFAPEPPRPPEEPWRYDKHAPYDST